MKIEELDYQLPQQLIAQQPARFRSKSRLLVLNRRTGGLTDSTFDYIGDFLKKGDCLVLNNTMVLPARFFAQRSSGAKLEGLFLSEIQTGLWTVLLKGAKKVKPNEKFIISGKSPKFNLQASLAERKEEGICLLKLETNLDYKRILAKIGFPPLPPYIKRDKNIEQAKSDSKRYQTVFAKIPGAVAAPTAGLHFTKSLITKLKKQGIRFAYVTLQVGPGTFKPIKTKTLEGHIIGSETFSIDENNAEIINETKRRGGRIIAVGTTSVRTLETAANDSIIRACSGNTNLFIKPGFKFKIVDCMITNFHLPRSTLLALVAAFAGLDTIKAAYSHAIEKNYRFYSYGDAMLII
jgi:S-adenosylmethionine:tRNA ribosyltransferase-isomerase